MVIYAIRSYCIRGADRRPSGRAIIVKWPYVVIHPKVSLVMGLGEV